MQKYYDATSNCFLGNEQTANSLGQVMWHITNKCNLNCLVCFTKQIRVKTKELEKKEILPTVNLLKKLGVQKIDLSGGEPLQYRYFPFLVSTCLENGIFVTVTTSGWGTEENISWICKNWNCFSRIIESLDGGSELHNTMRGSSNAFDKLIAFHERLKCVNCSILRINTVLTSRLLLENRQIVELSKCISKLRPLEWCLIQPYPINKRARFDDYAIDKNSFFFLVDKCRSLIEFDIDILTRINEDYVCYWALYGNDELYYSTNMQYYDIFFKLGNSNLDNIREQITKINVRR